MKQFFKFTFASVFGIFIACFIFLFIIVLIGVFSSKQDFNPEDKTILHLKLEGNLVERTEENPLDIIGNYFNQEIRIGLDDILKAIRVAKENPNIKGIYIESGLFSASTASIQEIRSALIDFKKSDKFIVAYGGTPVYLQNAYYLSSLADEIIMNPQGMLFFKGLSAQPLFLKNTLEKLDIDMQIFKVGSYKSATEAYTNDKMSDESKEQVMAYVQSIWKQMLQDISSDRDISVDSLQSYANKAIAFRPSAHSVSVGLIDTLMYASDVIDYLKEKVEIEKKEKIKFVGISEAASAKNDKKDEENKIAVIYAVGGIDDGSASGIHASSLTENLLKLRDDEEVKAIVLRVNSPGGSAYGAEQIWKAIKDVKAEKPVVISMGDYAASGGYYIAAPANYIIAQSTTLTGSIGIFGIVPNFSGFYSKLGFSFDQVKTNEFSDMPNQNRPMSDEEKILMQAYVDNGYDLFLTRCSEGRLLSKESIHTVAQGRVWTGEAALELGLIDELGGLQDAINKAAGLADIENFDIVSYPKKKSFLATLLNEAEGRLEANYIEKALGKNYKQFEFVKQINSMYFLQARLPFEFVMN